MLKYIPHILVVDDDDKIRNLVKKYLEKSGYFVSTAKDAEHTRDMMLHFKYDLIIIDVMMPQEDGISLAASIRKSSSVFIFMLTAIDLLEIKVKGFESGIDDYIVKPFEAKELLLRIKAIFSRNIVKKIQKQIIEFGDIKYNLIDNSLMRHQFPISLTTSEKKILRLLAENINAVVDRQKIVEVCGDINDRSVDVQIARLRQKMEHDPKKPFFLQTIRGEGYALYGKC